jgi:hypothetical protein
VSTAHQQMTRPQTTPLSVRSRLSFNEQLSFFAPKNDVAPPRPVGWWATLGLVFAVLPWALVALMIWMFA